jgi:hypothetical protein
MLAVFAIASRADWWAGLVAVALLAAFASRTGGGSSAQALTSGYHLAWAAGAVLGGVAIVVAAISLRERRPSSTDAMTDSDGSPSVLASCASDHRS